MATIPLPDGLVAFVDDEDLDWLNRWSWSVSGRGALVYATAFDVTRGRSVSMHRLIMGEPGSLIDHVNGNTLDNRRENLRCASVAQNRWNSRRRTSFKSPYIGVCLMGRLWRGRVVAHGKSHLTDGFLTAEGAALERDLYAVELHGDFASLNFPELARGLHRTCGAPAILSDDERAANRRLATNSRRAA